MKNHMWKLLSITAVAAIVHLAAVAFILSKTTYTRGMQLAYDILSFPLVYADRLNYRGGVPTFLDFDWVPVLVVLNSVLWGTVIGVIYWWLYRRKVGRTPANA
jgi:hypothetical protein